MISFEPQRFNFYNLCTNIFLNGLLNAVSYELALGDKESKLFVPVFDPKQSANFGAVKLKRFLEGEGIRIVPLEYMRLTQCKLIKIDVEGMEVEVLEEARRLIQDANHFLYVENNTIEGSEIILRKLASLNYRSYWAIEPYYNSNNFFEDSENIFGGVTEANLFCIHNDIPIQITELETGARFQRQLEKSPKSTIKSTHLTHS